ncbi:unnamed protein product [Rotaria sp. Silwood1]|nr:unnamed protein product [Rotaria sp. Silwood1]
MDNFCNYIVNKSDNSIDICISYQCNKYVDPYSIMVTPNNCDLFSSKSSIGNRVLIIFINYIDNDDKPVHHNELIRLGNHIDLYELFIKNLPNNYYLYQSIHYDRNYSQWHIIKVEL